MKVAKRLGRETLAQMLGFGVQLADRILLAALLLRMWSVADFAAWSLIVAAGGMIAFFDMGVNLYFANRVLFLVQQRRTHAARVLLRAGNTLMILASAVGLVAVTVGFAFIETGERGVPITNGLWLAVGLYSLSSFFRVATTVHVSLYRAHERFARQTMLWILIDFARIIATVLIVLLGGGFIAAATAQLLVSMLGHGYVVLVDSRQQFPRFPFGLGFLPRRERRAAFNLSFGFWVQSAPNTAMTHLPIFLLTGVGSTALLAQFVLMRTLANFVRAVLQPFAVVFAQESARRRALYDEAGVSTTYRESTFLLGALGAVPAGLLLALGPDLFALWTSQPRLFSQLMLLLAVGPPLLLPSVTVAQAFLATVNDPWPIAIGRLLQFGSFLLLYVLLPIDSAGLRMMSALAIAEPLGLGFILGKRIRSTVGGAGYKFQLEALLRLGIAVSGIWLATTAASAFAEHVYLRILLGLVAGGVAGGAMILLVGLERGRRATLFAHVVARRSR